MNQSYAEAGVKRVDTPKTILLRSLLIIGILVGLIILFKGGIIGILGAAVIVVMIYLFPKLNIEYEYVFVDGQLDFDRISGKSKRKTVLRIDFDQVDIMAPEGSHALDSHNQIQCDKKDFSSGRKDKKPYVIMASIDNKKLRILFEPNEKMIDTIKQKSPRKLSEY